MYSPPCIYHIRINRVLVFFHFCVKCLFSWPSRNFGRRKMEECIRKSETPLKRLPFSIYLLLEIHNIIFCHHKVKLVWRSSVPSFLAAFTKCWKEKKWSYSQPVYQNRIREWFRKGLVEIGQCSLLLKEGCLQSCSGLPYTWSKTTSVWQDKKKSEGQINFCWNNA